MANVAGSPVAVIGKGLNDNCDAGGAVALVDYLFIISAACFAGSLFDYPVDIVVGDVVGLSLGDNVLEL